MKKLFVTMLAVVAAATSFAQNPDGLKQVMSAEKKSDAAKIMKEQSGTMTAAEKVKAYVHLVDMAVEENAKEAEKALKLSLDPAKKDEAANHKTKQYKAAADALKYAMEANKAANEPIADGQEKPKFKKSAVVSKTLTMRNELVNGGSDAYKAKDFENAAKFFGAFAASHVDPLYADNDAVQKETNYTDVAYYASVSYYLSKDFKNAVKFAKIAEKSTDAQTAADALNVELSSYEDMLKAGTLDAEGLIKKMKEAYKNNPTSSVVFAKYIASLYDAKKNEEADKVLAERIQSNPNDPMANAYVGKNAMDNNDYVKAIPAWEKAIQGDPKNISFKAYLADCYRMTAVDDMNNKKPYKENLQKALSLYEEVKKLDPEQKQFKTQYFIDTIQGYLK